MMDFVDSLRRGVDRAGFEIDRLLRANRVRSRVNALRSEMDEEVRQIGHQVVELYQRGELVQEELRAGCERVKQRGAEIVRWEAELEAINREASLGAQPASLETARPPMVTCPKCGATIPEDANYCLRCGADLKAGL